LAEEPVAAVATRTLRAAGFEITQVTRHASHIEYLCEREDAFGATVRYVFAISSSEESSPDTRFTADEATATGRTLVLVARNTGANCLSWDDFLAVLGGAVPTWRALDGTYADALTTASRNELPAGLTGEAWRAFEAAVADGLEFMFGRRVQRMGGVQRFKPVPDMLALTPDDLLLLVDAKAAGGGVYQLERPKLRPLGEYVDRQRARQAGGVPLGTALIVAGRFEPRNSLDDICNDFLADKQLPLTLLEVDALLEVVARLRDAPTLRPRLRWRRLLSRVGLTPVERFIEEIEAARTETWNRDLRSEA
jgi:hypothetical protein